jgi:hypothetical protein
MVISWTARCWSCFRNTSVSVVRRAVIKKRLFAKEMFERSRRPDTVKGSSNRRHRIGIDVHGGRCKEIRGDT